MRPPIASIGLQPQRFAGRAPVAESATHAPFTTIESQTT